MGMGQNPIPLVNPKIAGNWMFIPLKMVSIGIDPYPNESMIKHYLPLIMFAVLYCYYPIKSP